VRTSMRIVTGGPHEDVRRIQRSICDWDAPGPGGVPVQPGGQ
jgi:hypothetical protein